jgi:hypothetical protein
MADAMSTAPRRRGVNMFFGLQLANVWTIRVTVSKYFLNIFGRNDRVKIFLIKLII